MTIKFSCHGSIWTLESTSSQWEWFSPGTRSPEILWEAPRLLILKLFFTETSARSSMISMNNNPLELPIEYYFYFENESLFQILSWPSVCLSYDSPLWEHGRGRGYFLPCLPRYLATRSAPPNLFMCQSLKPNNHESPSTHWRGRRDSRWILQVNTH